MMTQLQKILSTYNVRERFHKTTLWLSVLTIFALVFDFGFEHSAAATSFLIRLYMVTLLSGIVSEVSRHFSHLTRPTRGVFLFDLFTVLFLALLFVAQFGLFESLSFLGFYVNSGWVYAALILIFVREFSALRIDLKRSAINPAQLFILSFLILIALGTLLLLLPNSTNDGISVLNALFTATSAVCVTGLIVVDTGSFFTPTGQTIILGLIQLGGLGIMTFASYFSYFFRGGTSYENQLALRDITNADKLGEVFGTLKKIIFVTFSIEAAGAVLIYLTLDKSLLPTVPERLWFAIFHSISAFCNAGFSTLPNSLYETGFRFNYPLHLVISALFIVGGLGFPIVFNLFRYARYVVSRRISRLSGGERGAHRPWIVSINTRIVIITSFILTVAGTLLFYVLEYRNTLAEHSGLGKIVTAFFGATVPRTAGFNTVDNAALAFPTVMLVFLLMWIGASPASTGGGIKTSTFAIAILNFISLARGKERTEIYRREIADVSIRRAFALMFLSLLVIGAAVFLISIFDSEKDLLGIAFECFSAYSTVGLSVGITSSLSNPSKFVIILVMFIGRVSALSILIAIMKKSALKNYRYPSEEILIN